MPDWILLIIALAAIAGACQAARERGRYGKRWRIK